MASKPEVGDTLVVIRESIRSPFSLCRCRPYRRRSRSRVLAPSPCLGKTGPLLTWRWIVDDFQARSSDELSLAKGDRVELLERDDEFGDGWFLGRHMANANTGLFPEGNNHPPAPDITGHFIHHS